MSFVDIICNCCQRGLSQFKDEIKQEGDIIYNPYVILEDNLTFVFGLSGTYQLIDQLNATPYKKDDVICWTCLKDMKYIPYLSAECGCCHNKFQSIDSDMNEGWGCASNIIEFLGESSTKEGKYIYCGYGSRYDDSMIKLLEDPFKWEDEDILICDDCIDLLESEGKCQFNQTEQDRSMMVPLKIQSIEDIF